MDFGVIYLQDKTATRAAMWLGGVIFIIFILLPYLAAYLFIPLYLIVIAMALMGKFKGDELKYALLIPIIPFGVAIVLCLLFWWAIPAVVNFANDCLEIVMMDDTLFKPDIPDSKCYLYFVLVLGGGVGSMMALLGIVMPKDSNVKQTNKLQHTDRKPAEPPMRYVPDFTYMPSRWDGASVNDISAGAHETYRYQQYNVDKWKQRQKRKEEKRNKRSH